MVLFYGNLVPLLLTLSAPTPQNGQTQFVCSCPPIVLSVFDHFAGLALKRLILNKLRTLFPCFHFFFKTFA